jgi:hypothetical protein
MSCCREGSVTSLHGARAESGQVGAPGSSGSADNTHVVRGHGGFRGMAVEPGVVS